MSDASDVLELAKKQYKAAVDGWKEVYTAAKADLDFMSDAQGSQWNSSEFNSRTKVGRPAPQLDQLTQFKHQVVNDIRMNTPTINVIPADLDSDPKTAEMIAGRIKAIEYKSNADSAYDMAVDFSVGCSIGFIRVDRQYVNDESFEQELCIRRETNPLSILIDPESNEPDGSDAMFGFIKGKIPTEDFSKKWPDAVAVSFGEPSENESSHNNTESMINIVEYFVIDTDEDEYGLLPNGSIKTTKGTNDKFLSKRIMKKRVVRHYKLSGEDILEETVFPGKYIPLVPVYGEEFWNNGKRHLFSLIRKAKDAQRMFNLWKGLETELLLKQQQAPVQAAVGQMRGFEDDWSDPAKAMVLYYHQTDINGNPAPAPQRLQPPTIPTGVVNASQGASNNIREILGMYNASAGKREGDASGIALKQLDQSSDVGNFHFSDNLTKSVTQVGRILVYALPEVEDTARTVTIIDKEENFKLVGINGAIAPDQEQHYKYTTKYDVRVTTGASYTTQRQQAAELYQNTLKILPPEAAMNVLDLVFKYQDTPGSQAMEARLKKMVNPQLLDSSERKQDDQPDPLLQQAQQQLQQLQQQAQAQIQQLQQALESKQADTQIAQVELQLKAKELDIKAAEAQAKIYAMQKPDSVAAPVADLHKQSIEERAMALKEAEFHHKVITTDSGGADMPLEDTLEILQQKVAIKQQQEQQKAMIEQMRIAEEAEKRAQTEAILKGMQGIQEMIGGLISTISAPITIEHDSNGNIIGVK